MIKSILMCLWSAGISMLFYFLDLPFLSFVMYGLLVAVGVYGILSDPRDFMAVPPLFLEPHVLFQMRFDFILSIILTLIYLIEGFWFILIAGIVCGLFCKGALCMPGLIVFVYPPYFLVKLLSKEK